MANVTLTITIPEANVPVVQAVVIELARQQELIEPTETLSSAQAKAWLEGFCKDAIRQLVRNFNAAKNSAAAREAAAAVADSIF